MRLDQRLVRCSGLRSLRPVCIRSRRKQRRIDSGRIISRGSDISLSTLDSVGFRGQSGLAATWAATRLLMSGLTVPRSTAVPAERPVLRRGDFAWH